MEHRDIYITKFDLARLKELLQVGISFTERDRNYLESLQNELDRAHIVEPTAIPDSVVTMNSRVRLKDMETGEEKNYTSCFHPMRKLSRTKFRFLLRSAPPSLATGLVTQWTGSCRPEHERCESWKFFTNLRQPAATICEPQSCGVKHSDATAFVNG